MEANKTTKFWDNTLPIEERLDWLIANMTIEEKLSCLCSSGPAIERLGIPGSYVGSEAAHGIEARNDQNPIGKPDYTTSLPQPIGMGATWDKELLQRAGDMVGREARALYKVRDRGGLCRWAPTVDLERDPRWGRNEESYGEDPLLTGEMAGAYIKGMQGDDPRYLHVAATLKHFYGNNTEDGRTYKSSSIDSRNRYELYLEPFRRCIEEAGAEAVMTAYNRINGTVGMLNHEVQDILKNQYGLKHAVCDGGALELVVRDQHYFESHAQSIAASVKAGVDAMSDRQELVDEAAKEAYEKGLLTEEEVNRAIRNTFRTKLRLGIYDRENENPYDRVTEADRNTLQNQEICKEVSKESIVLLKNESNILPLKSDADVTNMALAGPLGDVWYQDWYGGTPLYQKTLRQGIQEVTGSEIPFADGLDRVLFRCGDGYLGIGEKEQLCICQKPEIFIEENWGEGSYTYRSVRTGRYMNLEKKEDGQKDGGRMYVASQRAFDWFVLERMHKEEREDGMVILTDRFENPLQADDAGNFSSVKKETAEGTALRMEVVENGLEKALSLMQEKEMILLALGCNPMINAKEEVDRKTLTLPPYQERLLEKAAGLGKPVILVLFTNYPYAILEAQAKIPAIISSATGSQDMGTAMAEALFGRTAPAGCLNMTWYQSVEQLPDIDDYDIIQGKRTYRYFDGEVLYPFGYGLNYTTFAYGKLEVTLQDNMTHVSKYRKTPFTIPEAIGVRFEVTNTGERTSDKVVQVYGVAPASRVKKPVSQLLAFERLKAVRPGETRQVAFEIPAEDFRFYDVISESLMVEEGTYRIYVGDSCKAEKLSAAIFLPGKKPGNRRLDNRLRADHYDTCENMILVEGQQGYTAVTPKQPEQEGLLNFMDCLVSTLPEQMTLAGMGTGTIHLYADGKCCGSWNGTCDTWTEIQIPVAKKNVEFGEKETFSLQIGIEGEVKLLYVK